MRRPEWPEYGMPVEEKVRWENDGGVGSPVIAGARGETGRREDPT